MLVQALLDLGDEVIGTCGAKVVPVAERLENSFQVASVDVVALITPPRPVPFCSKVRTMISAAIFR